MKLLIPIFLLFLLGLLIFFFFTKIFQSSAKKQLILPSPNYTEKVVKWEQEKSDISAHSEALFGYLENGIRYVILPNKRPENRASMHLYVRSGSLMESPKQLGLSHFLEHLLFNGTRNYPPGTLIPRLQKRGMDFGSDINGTTYFDRTIYKLETPDVQEETIDTCITVLRDYADGALLVEKEIESERGVILAEKTSGESTDATLLKKWLKVVFSDTFLVNRTPIGKEKIIKTATREEFLKLYRQYYTPNRMTLVIVGDINPKEIERKIGKAFSSVKQPKDPGKAPQIGNLLLYEKPRFSIIREKETPETLLTLYRVEAKERPRDNTSYRKEKIQEHIISLILEQKFSEMSEETDSPITDGWAGSYHFLSSILIGEIGVSVSQKRWRDALTLLEKEVRSRLLYGFSKTELDYAKRKLLNKYQNRVKAEGTIKSSSLAKEILRKIAKNNIITEPKEDFQIAKEILKNLTPQDLQETFQAWNTGNLHFVLSTSSPWIRASALRRTYLQSKKKLLNPPEEEKIPSFAYDFKNQKGEMMRERKMIETDITLATLENGIKIQLKPTSFQKNQILFRIRFGKGFLETTEKVAELKMFAEQSFLSGGLKKHPWKEIQKLIAGHSVSLQFEVEEDGFIFAGSTTPKDLDFQLSLLRAYFTEPAYAENASNLYQRRIPEIYREIETTPTKGEREFRFWLRGKDPRFSPPTLKEAQKANPSRLKKLLQPALQKGSMEISLVGDFEEKQTLNLITQIFGNLSERNNNPIASAETQLFPINLERKETQAFPYKSKIDKDITIAGWKLSPTDKNNISKERRTFMISQIYSERMRILIREKLGIAYSPYAYILNSETFPDFHYLLAFNTEKEKQSKKIHQILKKIGEEIAQNGIQAEELELVLSPFLERIKRSRKTNEYWIYVLDNASKYPQKFQWAISREKDYASITAKELTILAKEIFKEENRFSATITSE